MGRRAVDARPLLLVLLQLGPRKGALRQDAGALGARVPPRRTASVVTCGCDSWHSPLAAHGSSPLDRANFTGVVLGCIEAKFCK